MGGGSGGWTGSGEGSSPALMVERRRTADRETRGGGSKETGGLGVRIGVPLAYLCGLGKSRTVVKFREIFAKGWWGFGETEVGNFGSCVGILSGKKRSGN